MHDKKLYGTATVGTKGQVVIPAAAREALAINEGDKLYVLGSEKAGWIGFIKEDQLAQLLNKMVDNVESFQQILRKDEK
ncbi:AbrB/MazE/SpoVT family DNA-binding domain-containing protein [Candidatus Saccharibacteria bacterium]|nr:AbrB/MazE/SpoVT family DNA-binding domain-containing protein [Candidatus Saccharibacteria bacterium]MBH2007574.1 AbrB/MazE/SpoVT family DNA-binding domain-containing protein [Candidatus Saccharibacteria bacterium]